MDGNVVPTTQKLLGLFAFSQMNVALDNIEFDDAVGVCKTFAQANPNTLFIVTAADAPGYFLHAKDLLPAGFIILLEDEMKSGDKSVT